MPATSFSSFSANWRFKFVQAGIALILRAAFVADPAELAELTLPVLARDDGAEFSFSSGSLADDTDGNFSSFSSFSLLLDVDARNFDGSRIDADMRRWCIGALIVLGVEPARAADGPDGIRVGVAVADELRARDGGGPIAPWTDERFSGSGLDVLAEPLGRTLPPNVDLVAVEGVSLMRRSFATLPVSESAEGGREPATLGVPKMDDSRR